MDSSWKFRGVVIALVTLAALWLLVPSYYYFRLPAEQRNDARALKDALPGWIGHGKKVNLGLDLQGGIHLVMAVDVDAALATKATNRATELKDALEKKGLTGGEARVVNQQQVQVTLPPGNGDAARAVLAEFEDMEQVGSGGEQVTLAFRAEALKSLKDGALEQSIKAIRNRVDKFGVAEPTIARRGANHILVQLPGFKDPEQAKELIGKTAQLEFRMVDDTDTALRGQETPEGISVDAEQGGAWYASGEDQKQLTDWLKSKAPAGKAYALARIEEPGRPVRYRSYLLEERASLTGEYLTDARVQMGDDMVDRKPHVSLTFNKRGADLFEQLTGANIGKRMAIVLDGIVDSAPTIQDKISGGNAQITLGGYKPLTETVKEAQNLALVLKAGALPAPVTVAEQRSVGASLGPELIHRGALAMLVGTLLIVLFMFVYYRLSGLVADVALVMNGILTLAALALFGASLTLPGIAGIVLTLGVAVDANVIINERIREELRSGKTPRAALQLGYEKAFAAIFDSNLTTVLAGIVLLQYGTGPVRGFAVTLIIGVTASMFTAVFVTRWIMELLVARRPERLSV